MIIFILGVVALLIAIPFMNRPGKDGRRPGNRSGTDEFANTDPFFTTSASDRYGDSQECSPATTAADNPACADSDASPDSGSCDSGDSGGSDGGGSD